MITRKVYTGVVRPNRDPDYVFSIEPSTTEKKFLFWFDEEIIGREYTPNWIANKPNTENIVITDTYYFFRVCKVKVRYRYKEVNGRSYSLTGDWVTSYADKVVASIEKAYLNWMATKAIEEEIKDSK
jgi:hypothetical protein